MADEKVKDLLDVRVFHTAVTQEHVAALAAGGLLQKKGHLREKGVAQVREDAANQAGPVGTETAGQQVPAVAVLAAESQDTFPGHGIHTGDAVESTGYSGTGDPGQTGDILDGDLLHNTSNRSARHVNGCTKCATNFAENRRGTPNQTWLPWEIRGCLEYIQFS